MTCAPARRFPARGRRRRGRDPGMHLETMMTKLKLRMDELRVESFPVTAHAAEAHGTVQAHEAAAPTMPIEYCFRSLFPTCGIQC